MNVTIQIAAADDLRAWALLQRHSAGVALPNRTYVVSHAAIEALRNAGVQFHALGDDAATLTEAEAASSERI